MPDTSPAARQRGRRLLREAFERLQAELPTSVGQRVRALRHPRLLVVRVPVAILLIIGGLLSFLPVLGLWMLPAGLLLLALDVPTLRPVVARGAIRVLDAWARLRARASTPVTIGDADTSLQAGRFHA